MKKTCSGTKIKICGVLRLGTVKAGVIQFRKQYESHDWCWIVCWSCCCCCFCCCHCCYYCKRGSGKAMAAAEAAATPAGEASVLISCSFSYFIFHFDLNFDFPIYFGHRRYWNTPVGYWEKPAQFFAMYSRPFGYLAHEIKFETKAKTKTKTNETKRKRNSSQLCEGRNFGDTLRRLVRAEILAKLCAAM